MARCYHFVFDTRIVSITVINTRLEIYIGHHSVDFLPGVNYRNTHNTSIKVKIIILSQTKQAEQKLVFFKLDRT